MVLQQYCSSSCPCPSLNRYFLPHVTKGFYVHEGKRLRFTKDFVTSLTISCFSRAQENYPKGKTHETNGCEECRQENLPVFLGRRLTLFATFVPPPNVLIPSFLGKKDFYKDTKDMGSLGFDGLGKTAEEYIIAKVIALAQSGDGAILYLGIVGYETPLRMVIGPAEAMAVLQAAQERQSPRPVTHEAWCSSLTAVGWKVDRVAITSLHQDIFYSQAMLSPMKESIGDTQFPYSRQKSLDMRPSDGIALALRCHAPLFVCRIVVEQVIGERQRATPRKSELNPLENPGLQAHWVLPPLTITRKAG